MTHFWSDNWQGRIKEAISASGLTTVSAFLERHPGVPYAVVAKLLRCAPAQLAILHLEEAKRLGAVRAAAADSLVRTINEHLRGGWGVGYRSEFKYAAVVSDWITMLEMHFRGESVVESGRKVWASLEAMAPPIGWKPVGSDDPLIQEAFKLGWDFSEL